jgi:hypothetical protein
MMPILDLVLVTGDMTDAGRSTEWAEFHEALRALACGTDPDGAGQPRRQYRRSGESGALGPAGKPK